jgi:hypothetical protein
VFEVNFNPDITTQQERPRPNPLDRANWDRSDTLMFEAMQAISGAGTATSSAPTLHTGELREFRLRFWRNYAPQRY